LPDTHRLGITELGVNELRRVDADDRQISFRIVTDQNATEHPPVRQRDLHPVSPVNHVAVG